MSVRFPDCPAQTEVGTYPGWDGPYKLHVCAGARRMIYMNRLKMYEYSIIHLKCHGGLGQVQCQNTHACNFKYEFVLPAKANSRVSLYNLCLSD